MGNAYTELKNYREAIERYQKAIAINPNEAGTYYNMGNTYRNLENYHEAIQCWQKVVAIDPNKASAYYSMGSAYGNLGNRQEQIKCYRQAARLGHQGAQEWLRENGLQLVKIEKSTLQK
jgi:superkiller protein 3